MHIKNGGRGGGGEGEREVTEGARGEEEIEKEGGSRVRKSRGIPMFLFVTKDIRSGQDNKGKRQIILSSQMSSVLKKKKKKIA